MYRYQATVVRIVDGDTMYLDVDLGFFIRMVIDVRLNGINTPEIRGPEREAGLKAKAFVSAAVPPGTMVLVDTYKAEKYGRYLADVWYKPGAQSREQILAGGLMLNRELVEKGLAEPYNR